MGDAGLNLFRDGDLPLEWRLKPAEDFDVSKIEKRDLGIKNKLALVLYNVLTPEECTHLIEQSEELGYKRTGYSPSYRSNTRIIIEDLELTDLIWNRIKSFLPTEFHGWEIVGLNERWRFCRYVEGQHFGAHNDACYVRGTYERSFLTAMLYLNGGFEGGCTNFLEGVEGNLLRLPPQAGMLLIFQHNILHEGEQLKSDRKYIMRSDIVYKKDPEIAEKKNKKDRKKDCIY